MKRIHRQIEDVDSSSEERDSIPNTPSNSLMRQYSPVSRSIVRYALLAHSGGYPLSKKRLTDENGAAINLSAYDLNIEIQQANKFMQSKLGLDLVELKQIALGETRRSPLRGEYLIVSRAKKHRSIFHQVSDPQRLRDLGVLEFVLIQILLRQPGVTFTTLINAFMMAQLHKSRHDRNSVGPLDGEERKMAIKKLKGSLQRLVAMRMLESVDPKRKTNKSGIAPLIHATLPTDDEDTIEGGNVEYFMGPGLPHVITGHDLLYITLKLLYRGKDITKPEFLSEKKAEIDMLVEQIGTTCLEFVASGNTIQPRVQRQARN